LPISDSSSAEMIHALLAEGEERELILAACLASEPALALWAVCVLARRGNRDVQSVPEIVVALESMLPGAMVGVHLADESLTPAQCDQFAELAASGVVCAHSASTDGNTVEYLAGLLSQADEILAVAGPQVALNDARQRPKFLPAWLVDQLKSGVNRMGPVTGAGNSAMEHGARARARFLESDSVFPDRLPVLVNRLTRLTALEEDFDGQLEAAKLAAMKEFAYGASHEINNPLANISTRAQTLLRDENDPERRRKLTTIHAQAMRAYEMIADAMLFARPAEPIIREVDLVETVAAALDELKPEADEQATELVGPSGDETIFANVDADQIAVTVKALCANSMEAIGHGGEIRIAIEKVHADDRCHAEGVRIVVRDTGPGIPKEILPRVFDPYFSGREAGRGLGLGLPKCWRIVTAHGGQIDVESQSRQGAVFTIFLPANRD